MARKSSAADGDDAVNAVDRAIKAGGPVPVRLSIGACTAYPDGDVRAAGDRLVISVDPETQHTHHWDRDPDDQPDPCCDE